MEPGSRWLDSVPPPPRRRRARTPLYRRRVVRWVGRAGEWLFQPADRERYRAERREDALRGDEPPRWWGLTDTRRQAVVGFLWVALMAVCLFLFEYVVMGFR